MIRALLLRFSRACGFFALSRWFTRGQLRILCYHGIWLGPAPHFGDRLFMGAGTFARRMQMLACKGYRVLPLSDAVHRLRHGMIGSRDVVITIDDGWQGTQRHMLPVLADLGFPVTLYVPTSNVLSAEPVLPVLVGYLVNQTRGDAARTRLDALLPQVAAPEDPEALEGRLLAWLEGLPDATARTAALQRIGDELDIDIAALLDSGAFSLMSPEALRNAAERGVDLQLHTHGHSMHGMNADRVAEELRLNRAALANILRVDQSSFKHFCYPSGEHDQKIFSVLRKDGIETATTTEFGLAMASHSPLALPRILDGESMTELEFEARLSGFWSLGSMLYRRVQRSS